MHGSEGPPIWLYLPIYSVQNTLTRPESNDILANLFYGPQARYPGTSSICRAVLLKVTACERTNAQFQIHRCSEIEAS